MFTQYVSADVHTENSYNIEEFRKAKASQSAMTKAETEQAIIKIEDLFKKSGLMDR